MRYPQKQKCKLPTLCKPSVHMLSVCCRMSLVYLIFFCLYVWNNLGNLQALLLVPKMLEAVWLSASLSIGGTLLLDHALRAQEKSGR